MHAYSRINRKSEDNVPQEMQRYNRTNVEKVVPHK